MMKTFINYFFMQHLYPTLWSLVLLLVPALTSESPNDAFREALEQKNLELIQELVLKYEKINVNLQDKKGYTSLMFAIDENHILLAKQLLQRGDMNINIRNEFGSTALMLTVWLNHIAMVEQLLKRDDLDMNLQGKNGNTALTLAVGLGHIAMAKQLLKRDDTNVNIQAQSGSTALMLAIFKGYMPLAEQMFDRDNVDVNLQDERGYTVFMILMFENHIPLAEKILQRDDLNANLQTKFGSTALLLAIFKDHTKIVKGLLQRDDVDVNLQDNKNKNALAYIEDRHIDLNRLQDDGLYYVALVKRTQVPSLDKNHVLLQRGYLQALYAQQSCNQGMQLYRDILLVNKIANELAEEQQRTVFYQACLIGYESKNSHYSIDAKNIERYKKSSHYQPLVDKDLMHLLAGYLRKVNIKSVSYEADWVHLITCYLWANNRFVMEQHTAYMTLKEVHFWHNQHSPYTEFLDAANSTHERALFQVVHQQGGYEAVATQHFAHGLKQVDIIQEETQVLTKSVTELTPIIMVGLNTLTHQLAT